jgi:hypothetical protein
VEGRAGGFASPDLAGSHWRPTVSPRRISLGLAGDPQFVFVLFFVLFCFFFFSGRGSRRPTVCFFFLVFPAMGLG